MEPDRLDPPEHMWPALLLLGYRVAEFKRDLWMAFGDGLWRLRLPSLGGMCYSAAVDANRNAHRIACEVRKLYEDVPQVVHEQTLAAETARVLGRRPDGA